MQTKILVITYVSGKMEWMPYNVAALEHITACHDLVESMQIVPLPELCRYLEVRTDARVLIITEVTGTMEWYPMAVCTLNHVTQSHELIESMYIVEGVQ